MKDKQVYLLVIQLPPQDLRSHPVRGAHNSQGLLLHTVTAEIQDAQSELQLFYNTSLFSFYFSAPHAGEQIPQYLHQQLTQRLLNQILDK